MAKPNLKVVAPITDNRTVMPTRRPNSEYRTREHLTPAEVDKLIKAAGANRHGDRDALMILTCYRHALRVSELISLEWSQIDLKAGTMHVRRAKGGVPSTHPIRTDELRALSKLRKANPHTTHVFTSERGAPFGATGFARMLERAGEAAKLGHLKIHPHALRHSTGFKLANDGVDTRSLASYMGHANIQNTVKYSEMSPTRFKDFWRD